MFFEETFYPGLSDFDESGRLSVRSVFEAFENAGGRHSDAARDSIIDSSHKGVVWIIYEWRVRLLLRPRVSDPLSVTTWTGGKVPSSSVFRAFTLKTQTGETAALGEARLCLSDLETGRLSRITPELMESYSPEQTRVFDDAPPKLRPLPEYPFEKPFVLRRADLDFNRHVHNAAYVDFIPEALPEKVDFSEIRISYARPVKYGDAVMLRSAKTDAGYAVCVCADGEACTLIEIK